MTVFECVGVAINQLIQAGLKPADAAIDAAVLARHVLGWDQATYLCNREDSPPEAFVSNYQVVLNRRRQREPVAKITGQREFWGRRFEVTPDVLTPRPETELLVEETLALAAKSTCPFTHLVDVGTGSGCIAVTLACELPNTLITATDVSKAALEVARRNAARHDTAAKIRWLNTTFLDRVKGSPDIIVANLPYVPEASVVSLPPEVRQFEPIVALTSGPDGLNAIGSLISVAAWKLISSGYLVLEFGLGQADAVKDLVSAHRSLTLVKTQTDLQGIPRIAVIRQTRSLNDEN